MPRWPESKLVALGATLALGGLVSGCGRANLTTSSSAKAPEPSRSAPHRQAGPAQEPENVPIPLPLNAARATAFARAVSLTQADLVGATPESRSKASPAEQREAARCGRNGIKAVGGGRSPSYRRGNGLDRESISSAVEVLKNAAAVRSDLEYATSDRGIRCYARVLGRALRRNQSATTRVLDYKVSGLRVDVGGGYFASGLRIGAKVGIVGVPVAVQVFVDVASMAYGPAELDLYATSFVQPVPSQTEFELMRLMLQRARLQRL